MSYFKLSRARWDYQCMGCNSNIYKGQRYFRDEPHPFDSIRGKKIVRQLCLICVLGEEGAANLISDLSDPKQLKLNFEKREDGAILIPPRVELIDFNPHLLSTLDKDPSIINLIGPEKFEEIVYHLLDKMGFEIKKVGTSTFQKDGGIDIIAWPRYPVFPFLLAVQAKHQKKIDKKIGPKPVRELLGSVQVLGFNAGLLVTNTTFSPDAQWAAKKNPILLHLRDIYDLQRWLRNDFLREYEWRNIPNQIEVCPGVLIDIPKR